MPYFVISLVVFIMLQITIVCIPFNKGLLKISIVLFQNTMFEDLLVGLLEEEKIEDIEERFGLALGVTILWFILTCISTLVSLLWPVFIPFVLFFLIFKNKYK